MLKRTCLAVMVMNLLSAGSAQAQEFYSSDRTGSSKFTTVSFGTENQNEGSSSKSEENVVELQVEEGGGPRL